ncbi:hypothetical protein L873DRAFT_1799214 [Choiromyces venosus 120613-1]|uniref:Glycosyl hydrolase family 95 N-terminal domain-containing protein n=1 Tax=Choiromyces venosus 120613-1 TaxID=1336337 RepID=A0A3N4K589_9PEZI|nr:hypothetical protein L873DRAFT_1799214 [Choiromyces venosus 120613-1]
MRSIQQQIFQNGTGDISGDSSNHGSFSVFGTFSVGFPSLGRNTSTSEYLRGLDIYTGVAYSRFKIEGGGGRGEIARTYFCSSPADVCVYHIAASSKGGILPAVTVGFAVPRLRLPRLGMWLGVVGRRSHQVGWCMKRRRRFSWAGVIRIIPVGIV